MSSLFSAEGSLSDALIAVEASRAHLYTSVLGGRQA